MIYSIKAFFNIRETHTTDKSVINILAHVINNTTEAGYSGMFLKIHRLVCRSQVGPMLAPWTLLSGEVAPPPLLPLPPRLPDYVLFAGGSLTSSRDSLFPLQFTHWSLNICIFWTNIRVFWLKFHRMLFFMAHLITIHRLITGDGHILFCTESCLCASLKFSLTVTLFNLLAIWCLGLWVRILHSAEEDNLSPFDSIIACLCESIKLTTTYMHIARAR